MYIKNGNEYKNVWYVLVKKKLHLLIDQIIKNLEFYTNNIVCTMHIAAKNA